jgi:hypothetical protein
MSATGNGLSQDERAKVDGLLARLRHHAHAQSAAAKKGIAAIEAEGPESPNRRKIGAELMRIAGAVQATAEAAGAVATSAGLVEDAEVLAVVLIA